MNNHHESTYALLCRSEERSRGVLETALYASLILSAVFSIWQFAQQPVVVPAAGLQDSAGVVCSSAPENVRS